MPWVAAIGQPSLFARPATDTATATVTIFEVSISINNNIIFYQVFKEVYTALFLLFINKQCVPFSSFPAEGDFAMVL